MKIFKTTLLILGITSSLVAQKKNLALKGTLGAYKNHTVFLMNQDETGLHVLDSATTDAKGNFNLYHPIVQKDIYFVSAYKYFKFPPLQVILEPKVAAVLTSNNENLHLEHQLSGSKDNELLNTYQSYYNTLYYGQEALKTLSPEQQKPKEQELSKFYFEKNKEVQETVQKNPKALANIMALSLLHPLQNTDVAQIVLNNLKANYPYSKPVNLAFNELNKQLPVEVGMMAPEIKLENPEGKLISSKDYLGKVVLLDFWASWCMPCRMENPNVVKAYQKYHDKGFEILGVSLDNNKDKWLQAIAKDQLTWNHISDLKGWGSSATQIFKFSSIPLTILIGKDGKILAKNLRGPALEEKLEELFGK